MELATIEAAAKEQYLAVAFISGPDRSPSATSHHNRSGKQLYPRHKRVLYPKDLVNAYELLVRWKGAGTAQSNNKEAHNLMLISIGLTYAMHFRGNFMLGSALLHFEKQSITSFPCIFYHTIIIVRKYNQYLLRSRKASEKLIIQ